ncbi:hypothetical protein BD289DRAFT_58155 [Coniella lustricola]|uniref:Uncharacterized protein n=1 Tax=Coniella lustricola TaxID=2025994 RepID=A0A2T3AI87_9PEZI|nr:hypothetical protein BD289DRAFT_58155 [Coniella lustricola]
MRMEIHCSIISFSVSFMPLVTVASHAASGLAFSSSVIWALLLGFVWVVAMMGFLFVGKQIGLNKISVVIVVQFSNRLFVLLLCSGRLWEHSGEAELVRSGCRDSTVKLWLYGDVARWGGDQSSNNETPHSIR